MKAVIWFASLSSLLAACSPFSPDLGVAPYKCAVEEPRCPTGYTCDEGDPNDQTTHVCVANGETAPDAGGSGFQCLEDTFGQNDTKEGAFVTPVAAQNMMFAALTSLCPAGDQDHYQFVLTGSATSVRVATTWESGMPVAVSVLGAGGSPIGNGITHGDKENCVCVKDVPSGTYFVRVSAAANVQNNYRVEIKIVPTASCGNQSVCLD